MTLKGVTPVERIAAGMMLEVKTGDGMVFWPATVLRFGPRGCHLGSKSGTLTDFRKFPHEQEGRKEKEIPLK